MTSPQPDPQTLLEKPLNLLDRSRRFVTGGIERVAMEARGLLAVQQAGVIGLDTPANILRSGRALLRFGTVGGALANAAIRHPNRVGVHDEFGSLTFAELDARSNAFVNGFTAEGFGENAVIGVLCRNHRHMLEVTYGGSKAGFRVIYLNTDFAAPQARDVCEREGVEALIVDEEFLPVVEGIDAPLGTYVARTDTDPDETGRVSGHRSIESVLADASTDSPDAPAREGTLVILTSGTTGLPKGAPRPQPKSLTSPGAILTRIPFREAGCVLIGPPLFHAWGLFMAVLATSTASTVVLTRRFEPAAALDLMEEHRCTGFIGVPVMLTRMLELEDGGPAARDLSALEFIASSGAQLEPALANRTMDAFGDILHNLYGSTEVAYAAIATPEDLRAAPGTVGKPTLATEIRLFDEDGTEVPQGETGRIFVGNLMAFDGYTGGEDKDRIGSLVATGDVGHFDSEGRLVIDGRDDDMIVSGGENVFPGEVEALLNAHPAVLEAAVLGVPDDTMGQRLVAYVVRRDGEDATEDELRDHVRANLARYKVPRSITFMDELPRNPAGKVVKRELPGV